MNLDQCRCPTCGAVQQWQDKCRRCRTELGLLRQLADEIARTRSECFRALKSGDRQSSKRLAERLVRLAPTPFHVALCGFM